MDDAEDGLRMEFHDFQIRAWAIDQKCAAVLVHSSPAGGMSAPETVPLQWKKLDAFRKFFRSSGAGAPFRVSEGGQLLATIVFPDSVLSLLISSLERIDPEDGLRFRLCLDSTLSDLPWEYLVLPEYASRKSPGGFLALDARISLVRESPRPGRHRPILRKKQRLMFFGTRLCSATEDIWRTAEERDSLFRALGPAGAVLETQSVLSNETDCQTALMRSKVPVDIFHYSGHTDVEDGKGYLLADDVREDTASVPSRLYADALGSLLRRAGTTVAVFSACNSGSWAFVEPLLRAELPVVIGVQGVVYVDVAIAFYQRLYSALAIGLSLDEAVTWARLHLLEPGLLQEGLKWQWGTFIVYMQTPEAVLFPRPRKPDVEAQQRAALRERQVTIVNVTQNIGSIEGGTVAGVSAIRDRHAEKTGGA